MRVPARVRSAPAALTALIVALGLLVPSSAALAQQGSANSAAEGQSANAPSQANRIQNKVTPQAQLPDIEDEVMCPVCGTLLALAIESPQANRERDLIRGLIAQGLTKDQIKDRLVQEFGSEVLATPSTSGFDITAWLVPGLAVLAGAIGIFVGLRRWRRETSERGDSETAPSALSDEDAKRLEADLGKYEL